MTKSKYISLKGMSLSPLSNDVVVVPYDFRVAKFKDCSCGIGYWVRIYGFYTPDLKYHSFRHLYDCLEEVELCKELGFDTYIVHQEILVTPDKFIDIFNEIHLYVQSSSLD